VTGVPMKYCPEKEETGDPLLPGEFFTWGKGPDGLPKWFEFAAPDGTTITVPINGQKMGNGAGWQFNNDNEAPTLSPSIWCHAPTLSPSIWCHAPTDWHGWITNGLMTTC